MSKRIKFQDIINTSVRINIKLWIESVQKELGAFAQKFSFSK